MIAQLLVARRLKLNEPAKTRKNSGIVTFGHVITATPSYLSIISPFLFLFPNSQTPAPASTRFLSGKQKFWPGRLDSWANRTGWVATIVAWLWRWSRNNFQPVIFALLWRRRRAFSPSGCPCCRCSCCRFVEQVERQLWIYYLTQRFPPPEKMMSRNR